MSAMHVGPSAAHRAQSHDPSARYCGACGLLRAPSRLSPELCVPCADELDGVLAERAALNVAHQIGGAS